MRTIIAIASILGAFLATAPRSRAQSASTAETERKSLVVIFKDGHQESFPMSEVARLEFQPSPTAVSGQNRFLGGWKVGDCLGGYFNITLERDGVARKTYGSPKGTWMVVDGEARISWEDGWRDTLLRAGTRYEKVAFAPGRSYTEGPSCTASAETTEHKPI